MDIAEHDVVTFTEPVTDEGILFPIGTTGTVVSIYRL